MKGQPIIQGKRSELKPEPLSRHHSDSAFCGHVSKQWLQATSATLSLSLSLALHQTPGRTLKPSAFHLATRLWVYRSFRQPRGSWILAR